MKKYLIIYVLFFAAGLFAQTKARDIDKFIDHIQDFELLNKILGKAVIPPKGTKQSEVLKVFGKPDRIFKGKRFMGGYGLENLYTTHVYDIIPPKSKGFFGDATRRLCILYDNKNNMVVLGETINCSVEHNRLSVSLKNEEKRIFLDLLLVYNKFYKKLSSASWNIEAPPKVDEDKGLILE